MNFVREKQPFEWDFPHFYSFLSCFSTFYWMDYIISLFFHVFLWWCCGCDDGHGRHVIAKPGLCTEDSSHKIFYCITGFLFSSLIGNISKEEGNKEAGLCMASCFQTFIIITIISTATDIIIVEICVRAEWNILYDRFLHIWWTFLNGKWK